MHAPLPLGAKPSPASMPEVCLPNIVRHTMSLWYKGPCNVQEPCLGVTPGLGEYLPSTGHTLNA